MSEFRTEMKSGSGFVQELCLFVPAGCEELVPLVDGGELRLVHDRVLFHQAQSAWVGGGVEGGEGGEGPPLDGVVPVLVLQAPDVTRKAGVAPFARMAEAIYIYSGGGEVRGVHHRIQDKIQKPWKVFQPRRLQTWNCLEHTHLGVQNQSLCMESKVENPGQRPALQPSDQNLQTVCKRKVLYSQKTPPSFSQPSPRNWNFLPSHQNVSSQENRESESAWLRTTWSLSILFICIDISLLCSPEDCGCQTPHETGL